MTIETSVQVVMLVVIAGRKLKPELMDALADAGGRLATIIYAKGSVRAGGRLMEAFGFVPEENKVFIQCLMTAEHATAALEMLTHKFHFDRPNTGIAFTIPVEGLSH